MATTLEYLATAPAFDTCDGYVIVGSKARLAAADIVALVPKGGRAGYKALVESLRPGDFGAGGSTWVEAADGARKLSVIALSGRCSRHNAKGRPDIIGAGIGGRIVEGVTGVVLALDDADAAYASGVAVARSLPLYSSKSVGKKSADRAVKVALLTAAGAVQDTARIDAVAQGIRLAAELVDTPPNTLSTTAFAQRAVAVAESLGAEARVIDGEALVDGGFGGLVGVGKAAVHGPALVHLSYCPDDVAADVKRIAWVGKGIVYDTGGLSIKGKAHMPGMKTDMGGAAAVLGAFSAAVRLKLPVKLDAVLCLAENSVGPEATRPDDILTMLSGKTVEVNNTDAEGRLVLGDGVAFAQRHLAADVIADLATLTGAQLIATGKRHAAIVCNDADLEDRAVIAGRTSGDLVHPLPYAPEFFRSEFKSPVADMKNSVKDRMNAQSSCAGQFVAEHLSGFKGPWLHIDLAGPAVNKSRGTGFGVALLIELFG